MIVVIGILAAIGVSQFSASLERGRDSERFADITALKSHLHKYYQDAGAYPATLNTTTLSRVNPDFLVSPSGVTITNNTPVATEYEALAAPDPVVGANEYTYTPYPLSCSSCSGYVLKSAMEIPTTDYGSLYVLRGTYNN